jgi:hypothetical protein
MEKLEYKILLGENLWSKPTTKEKAYKYYNKCLNENPNTEVYVFKMQDNNPNYWLLDDGMDYSLSISFSN